MPDRSTLVEELTLSLKPSRMKHVLGVEKKAVELAARFSVDENRAQLAGLMHDCAKNLSPEYQLELALEYGYEVDEILKQAPALLHGPAGALLARRKYGIQDEAVLHAICAHTLPLEDMTALDKIIFVADMTEESRDYPGVDEINAAETLDGMYFLALRRKIMYVLEKAEMLHPSTVREYNRLLQACHAGGRMVK